MVQLNVKYSFYFFVIFVWQFELLMIEQFFTLNG